MDLLNKEKESYYSILGVPKLASVEQIQTEFRLKSLASHPDKLTDANQTSDDLFKKLTEAKTVLCDPEKRRAYDSWLEKGYALMPFSDWLKNYKQLKASFHFAPPDQTRKLPASCGITEVDIECKKFQKQSLNNNSQQLSNKCQRPAQSSSNSLLHKFRNYEV
ncbi:J domain-containing protein-like [Convolutriloba macropyga]|uniref:J domain-containing protein-like n=1 Tax=Convolutriloba macropyga TaxID=536237 RepID=UPI003F5206F2